MDDKSFVWTSDYIKQMIQIRFENDWLFKKMKQPWGKFHKILLENGFPEEMTVRHVRKKWSYTYDTYKIAKKTKNKSWKYYKMFEKHFGKNKILDKYESWSDEWRLKLITCIMEAKVLNLEFNTMWRTVERAMRCQDLPIDCCVQDMKGLWHHIRMTFNRKHRNKIKKGAELTDWPLYEIMLEYYQTFDPQYIINLENEMNTGNTIKDKNKNDKTKKEDNPSIDSENEFYWTRDITETFIQIRLQNDWLFRERKWAWNDFLSIMVEEHGFPKSLNSRDICRKWASIYSEFQKAKATNNKVWLYYNLFELYLGDGSLSLNPLVDWQEEWIFNLISTRSSLEHLFKHSLKEHSEGWREVEKRMRDIDLPLDHSLLDLPDIWTHLIKTFKWKQKFANKGILNEQWPYFEAMSQYMSIQDKQPIKKQKENVVHYDEPFNDDYEDDIKLFDLKQMIELKPKHEMEVSNQCRSCSVEQGSVNIFEQIDDDNTNVATKLKIIAGIQVDTSDKLPSLICLNCLQELENAYKFRRKCQDVDKRLRNTPQEIKVEEKSEDDDENSNNNDTPNDALERSDIEMEEFKLKSRNIIQHTSTIEKLKQKRRKKRKEKYDYWKVCEVCGKHTKNLGSHLDMHSKGKSYSCDVCDKKFKFRSGLIVHKAVHNSAPRKTCEVCGKTFHILAQYRRHFVYHANERKFECETCGKRFNTLEILKVHNRIHTDERPFSCTECGKTFRTAGCVSRHKRIVHRNIKKKQ